MPLKTETYRVLIASPSDLSEERRAAAEAINEWNAQHAVAESIVLLPVNWETHAMPQSGVRPQEAINNQLVRECDILVGGVLDEDWCQHRSRGIRYRRRNRSVRGRWKTRSTLLFQPPHQSEQDRPEATEEAAKFQGLHS